MFDLYLKLRVILTRSEKRRFLALLGAILVMAVMEVVGIASIMPFMQLVARPEVALENAVLRSAYEWLNFTSPRNFLMAIGGCVLALIVLSKAASSMTRYFQHRFVWSSAHSIGSRLIATYLMQPYSFFLQNQPTKLQKQIIGEVQQLVREVLLPIARLCAQGFVALIIFALLIAVDPKLALIVSVVLGGSYVVIYLAVRSYLARIGVIRFRLFRMRFRAVAETFGSVKAVKILGCERFFAQRFEEIDRRHSNLQPKFAVISETPQSVVEVLAFGGILVILLYLLAMGQSMEEIVPLLSLYAVAGHRLMPSLQQSFQAITALRFNHRVLDAIYDDFAKVEPVDLGEMERSGRRSALHFEEAVQLSSVTFRYPGSTVPVLEAIDITIPKGARVGFVGSTGSGKSTLVDIIMGLLRPTSGQLLVDGMPILRENVRSWQMRAGYVPQEVTLIDGPIARNIAFGQEPADVDMERVREVTELALLSSFVFDELPEGLETRVGERGARLSGGQRQRIGLARALYRDPDVLVLDEATSALDGITEDAVMEALGRLPKQMTIIMIAHRLETVRNCDTIYMLEGGRIVAQGTYDELLESNPAFRGMARMAS